MKWRDISNGGSEENDADSSASDGPNQREGEPTDWARVVAKTDDEVYRDALSDPDAQPMTPAQLARMRRAPNPREIRQRLGMTQEMFARQFQIPIGTLRDWEQGVHLPDSTAKAFLRVIEQDAPAVLRALHLAQQRDIAGRRHP